MVPEDMDPTALDPAGADPLRSSLDWDRAHQQGRTPWDLRGPTQPLVNLAAEGYFGRLGLPAGGSVAVPGCGRGHDLRVFADLGMAVTGFDVAPTAVAEAQQLLSLNRARGEVFCRDVLGLSPEFDGIFDLVYDYTCMCALRPALWRAYAGMLASILRPDGRLLTLAFPMMPSREPERGPPFRVLEADLVRTLTPRFRPVENFPAVGSPASRAGFERWYLWQRRS